MRHPHQLKIGTKKQSFARSSSNIAFYAKIFLTKLKKMKFSTKKVSFIFILGSIPTEIIAQEICPHPHSKNSFLTVAPQILIFMQKYFLPKLNRIKFSTKKVFQFCPSFLLSQQTHGVMGSFVLKAAVRQLGDKGYSLFFNNFNNNVFIDYHYTIVIILLACTLLHYSISSLSQKNILRVELHVYHFIA